MRNLRRLACAVALVLVLAVAQQASRSTGVAKANGINGETSRRRHAVITSGCDNTLWEHVYHPGRLQIHNPCTVATGVIVDATRGKNKDGCRHEADADGHCWLKLDPGQEQFLNQGNLDKQEGNLVFEPICRYRVTQEDAKAACKNYKQPLIIPPVGSHVRIVGAAVTDLQHGHKEFHPVWSITTLPKDTR